MAGTRSGRRPRFLNSPFCVSCGGDISRRDTMAILCWPCINGSMPLRRRAAKAVRDAILSGKLAPVSTRLCVDCCAPAQVYDHRDYARPLEVAPVCFSCNVRRGPADSLTIFARANPEHFFCRAQVSGTQPRRAAAFPIPEERNP